MQGHVVDGLAGTAGKQAVLKFVETYIGARVVVTINNNSVEKGGTGTVTYESNPHSETKVDVLLRNAAGYEIQSVWGDVPFNVVFRRALAELEFFAGKELVRDAGGGGLVMAELASRLTDLQGQHENAVLTMNRTNVLVRIARQVGERGRGQLLRLQADRLAQLHDQTLDRSSLGDRHAIIGVGCECKHE